MYQNILLPSSLRGATAEFAVATLPTLEQTRTPSVIWNKSTRRHFSDYPSIKFLHRDDLAA